MRWKLGRGAGGQSEDGGKKNDGGAIGVVVCAGTGKGGRVGGWNTPEDRKRGGLQAEGREAGRGRWHADPPEAPRNPGGRFK